MNENDKCPGCDCNLRNLQPNYWECNSCRYPSGKIEYSRECVERQLSAAKAKLQDVDATRAILAAELSAARSEAEALRTERDALRTAIVAYVNARPAHYRGDHECELCAAITGRTVEAEQNEVVTRLQVEEFITGWIEEDRARCESDPVTLTDVFSDMSRKLGLAGSEAGSEENRGSDHIHLRRSPTSSERSLDSEMGLARQVAGLDHAVAPPTDAKNGCAGCGLPLCTKCGGCLQCHGCECGPGAAPAEGEDNA